METKNRPDYCFNDNMIDIIKDVDSGILKINKLPLKGVFSLDIYYNKYIPTKTLNRVLIELIMMQIIFFCFLMM